ncbi:MAG TPA: phosphonatase-like hydrolase [Acidimicrobiales bacterium]|nr:phosphonatase-like hydrolase [Acidimicrobiales bacterium]
MITAACLDMAGTTVRDGGLVDMAFADAMAEVGLPEEAMPAARQYVHDTMGLPKGVVFRALLDGDESRADAAVRAFDASVMRAIAAGSVEELPGAAEAIAALRAEGISVCLTTGFTADVQHAIADHLGWRDKVDLLLAPSPGVRGRPYPDLVLSAVMRMRIDDVREVAVAGDTANDLLTGHRAGAGVVAGVLTGSHGRAELEAAPHTHILDSIADLPGLLHIG